MQIREILSENRNIDWDWIHEIGRDYYNGYYDKPTAMRMYGLAGLTYRETKEYLELASQGHPNAIGEPGLIPGGHIPGLGDMLNPINLGLTVGGVGIAGLGVKKVGSNIVQHGLRQGLTQSASQAVLAVVRDPATLARALGYAKKYPKFFSPKVLRKMDGIRTARFKKKIARLTEEGKLAMRDVERVKSILAQATFGSANSLLRQLAFSLVYAGGQLAHDIMQWSKDPDATIGDLVIIVGKAVVFEAAFILMLPVQRIISMAAKKPLESLWLLIKNLYSKYKNAVKVATVLAGLGSTTALSSSANVKNKQNVNEVFGLGNKKGKQAAFAFGRLNPATVGHELMVDAIKQQPGDSFLFLSDRPAKMPTDPLSPIEKLDWARLSFDGIAVGLAKTALVAADRLYKMGYTDIVFVEGEDKLFPLIERYNGVETAVHNYKFNSITQHRLTRNPDAEDASGMSASKMRQAVIDQNFELFRSGVTKSAQPQAQAMYDKLGQLLGVNVG
jgi:hypothetical protein